MKKFSIALFLISFIFCGMSSAKTTYTPDVNAAINMYKNRNYTECLQIMFDVVRSDPSNVLAYYYIAISEARLGNIAKAEEAYQRVIDLNSSTQLSKYSQNGIACLKDSTKCKTQFTLNTGSSKKVMDNVSDRIDESRIESIKEIVNTKKNIQEIPIEYMRDMKDYSLPQNQIQNKSELPVPTKEQVADAMDTLKRAGYQTYMQPPMTPEQMQMSMVNSLNPVNNNTYNNPMASFMPYMQGMNSQEMSQMSPELVQSMMMGSMMNGLFTDYNQR